MNKCVLKFMLALVLGLFVSAFSYSAINAQAADTEIVAEENVALADNAEATSQGDDGSAMILLLGGMLLIIIAVVITVVVTVVTAIPAADEI
jgi:ABC-type phosphate transport system permease subunit